MNNQEQPMVNACLRQGEGEDYIHMSVRLPQQVVDKMHEIMRMYPEGYWTNKDLDLLQLANEELEAEAEKEQK